MITQTTANVPNLNQVNTNYKAGGAASAPAPAAGGQQDSYTPSTDAGEQPVSYKQMLAASAGGTGGTQQTAAGGSTKAKSNTLTIGKDDYGVDASGNKIDPSKLAKSPVTSSNPQLQNNLNYLYSTKTGKAELDAIAKDHPGTTVQMGGAKDPNGHAWGKTGAVTVTKDGKDTIYMNPTMTRANNPKDNAALLAHEGWHVLSPNKNTLSQEKTADDLRNSVNKELQGNYGDEWAKTKGFDSVTWPAEDGNIYREDYHEYDGQKNKPAIGDIAAEGKAASDMGIPVDSDVKDQGDRIFNEESGGQSTTVEKK